MKKCSICGEWVDSFNGVTQYDDNTPVFICDCCFLQTESGQELLANVTAAQPLRAVDAASVLPAEQNQRSNIVPAVEFDTQPRN